jgi:hypothetical protein
VRRRIQSRGYDAASRRVFQVTLGVLSVTWGIGAALFAQWLPFEVVALLLIILCGLVAAATSTLAAQRLGFRLFLAGTLVPPMIGILAGELGRSRAIALVLIAIYALVMFVTHQRTTARCSSSSRPTSNSPPARRAPRRSARTARRCSPAPRSRSWWWTRTATCATPTRRSSA